MNIRTFLLGALCGAVVFAIVDRLVQEHERRNALREKPLPAARASQDSMQDELQALTRKDAASAPPQEPVPPEVDMGVMEEDEAIDADDSQSNLVQHARLPQTPGGAEGQDDMTAARQESQPSLDEQGEQQTAAQPDDASWSAYMEQTLRQFLARHPSAPKFDVLSIRCSSGLCEIRAAGFDESTWPVWGQVVYDLSQQSWYEFGEAAHDAGRFPEYDGRYVLRTKLKRQPRQ